MTTLSVAAAPVHARSSRRQLFLRLRRNRATLVGLTIVLAYAVMALFPSLFTPYEPNAISLGEALAPASAAHWLGTDEFGRDVLARILYGARLSLLIGFASVVIGIAIGGVCGLLAAYYGGLVDLVIMRAMDILLAIPGIMLAIALVAVLGPGAANMILALGIYNIPSFARVMRSTALSVCGEEYLVAARMIGAREKSIIARHLLPNCFGPLLVFGVVRFGHAILLGSGLSFVGLGIQPPTAEWGAMLAASRNYIRAAPHLAVAYGLSLSVLVVGFNAMGEGLRDILDPTTVR